MKIPPCFLRPQLLAAVAMVLSVSARADAPLPYGTAIDNSGGSALIRSLESNDEFRVQSGLQALSQRLDLQTLTDSSLLVELASANLGKHLETLALRREHHTAASSVLRRWRELIGADVDTLHIKGAADGMIDSRISIDSSWRWLTLSTSGQRRGRIALGGCDGRAIALEAGRGNQTAWAQALELSEGRPRILRSPPEVEAVNLLVALEPSCGSPAELAVLTFDAKTLAGGNQPDSPARMALGDEVEVDLLAEESFWIEVEAGPGLVTVETFGLANDTDTVLSIHAKDDPDGSELATNDDGGGGLASRLTQFLGERGALVRASGLGGSAASFSLRVSRPEATLLQMGESVEVKLRGEASRWFRLPVTAGHGYHIYTHDLSSETDTVLELHGPGIDDGPLQDDDGGGGFASGLFYLAENDTELWVRASGFQEGDAHFKLRVDISAANTERMSLGSTLPPASVLYRIQARSEGQFDGLLYLGEAELPGPHGTFGASNVGAGCWLTERALDAEDVIRLGPWVARADLPGGPCAHLAHRLGRSPITLGDGDSLRPGLPALVEARSRDSTWIEVRGADFGSDHEFVVSVESAVRARTEIPKLTLIDQDGNEVDSEIDSSCGGLRSWRLDPQKVYRLEIEWSADSDGRYWLQAEREPTGSGIQVGDRVRLGRHRILGGDRNWASGMEAFVGREARVTRVSGRDDAGAWVVRVDVDDGEFAWRVRDLEKLHKAI